MQYLEKEIVNYTQDVWSSFLGMTATRSAESIQPGDHFQHAYVQIVGAWTGIIVVHFPPDLAHQITEQMFSIEPGKVSLTQNEDALGEVANMVGGNIKSLLPHPSYISHPHVELDRPAPQFPGVTEESHITFECEQKNFVVSILKDAVDESLKKDITDFKE